MGKKLSMRGEPAELSPRKSAGIRQWLFFGHSVQLGREISAKKHNQIRGVYPRQQGHDGAHSAIDFLVVEKGHKLHEYEAA
jgi:hypothetical protein